MNNPPTTSNQVYPEHEHHVLHGTHYRCIHQIPSYLANMPPSEDSPEIENPNRLVPECALLTKRKKYLLLSLLDDWNMKFLYKTLAGKNRFFQYMSYKHKVYILKSLMVHFIVICGDNNLLILLKFWMFFFCRSTGRYQHIAIHHAGAVRIIVDWLSSGHKNQIHRRSDTIATRI